MASPNLVNILDLYQRALSAGTIEYLQKQAGMRIRRGIFSAQVVLWLMIMQRLHAAGTLAAAVQLLIQGAAQPLLQNCRRVRRRRISARTGGYCQARLKMPTVLCRQVLGEITHQLRQVLGLEERSGPRVYVLDGSSLELEHSRELVRSYPPAQNQHGVSHWPVLKIVVLHEMETALAEEPQWGPMYGPQAVSEQGLAEKAMEQLPAQSVILGDRNFGVLWVAYAAQQRGLGVVLRLTEARARKLFQGPISRAGDYGVVWQASRLDGGKHHRLPAQAAVTGRLIAARVGRGKAKQWLYLFTTLPGPAEEIVALYGGRWNIETDLRSLKRTVRLHHMAAKSPTMLEKELLMAVCAYNLVHAVMCLAARRSRVDPRQLSFAGVLNVVDCAWYKLAAATTPAEMQRELTGVLKLAAQCTLPKRKQGRSYPRRLWHRQPGFPYRKGEN
jgi:putative transposase